MMCYRKKKIFHAIFIGNKRTVGGACIMYISLYNSHIENCAPFQIIKFAMQWNILKASVCVCGIEEGGFIYSIWITQHLYTDSSTHMIDFLLCYKSCTALPWNI